MNNHLQYQSKLPSFGVLSTIGLAMYLLAWGVFHAYTASTVLIPIMIADLLSKISGRSAGGGGSGLGYFAVLVAAILSGLLFATLYWPIENWFVRARFPSKVRAGRMVAAFLFFLMVWLTFPLKAAL
jgi:hypothetical protein